uniref:Uncharacterized protein n=1 Tax=Manihot esculenta TaxID=3983 RepID=A0A2C9VV28_MANES
MLIKLQMYSPCKRKYKAAHICFLSRACTMWDALFVSPHLLIGIDFDKSSTLMLDLLNILSTITINFLSYNPSLPS